MSPRKPDPRAALVLALGLAACGGRLEQPAPAPAPVLPGIVLTDDQVSALAGLLRLEDRREYDAARIEALMRDPSPEVRRRAALAAGRIGEHAAVPLLLALLPDSSPAVRADAAFALGMLGDTAAEVTVALRALALSTAESDRPAAVEAVAALGKLGHPTARFAVEEVLRRAAGPAKAAAPAAPEDAVLGEALLAVWKFRRSGETIEAVHPHLAAADPQIRWRAAYALMRLGDPRGVPALRTLLADGDARVRAFAARGLRPAVVDSAGERAAATAALAAALGDPHPHVRINAARALAAYRDPAHAARLAALLGDADRNVAIAAAEALGELRAAAAAPALEGTLATRSGPLALRGAALASLYRIDEAKAAPHAATLAASAHWLERLYATRALRAAPWGEGTRDLLRRLAGDGDPRVAAGALESLTAFAGDSVPALYSVFIERLGAGDPGVRTAAIRGLATRAAPGDLPHFLQAYERAQRDSAINDAAVAAVAALGDLAKKGVPVQRSFFLRFSRSPDPVVRLEVERRLGRGAWGAPLPVETDRPLAFYEEVVRTLVAPELAGGVRPRVRILTAPGPITLELAAADAPLTVHNFLALVERGYFRDTRWHRVVPNFVLQDGDPRGDGSGGPGYAIRDEINRVRYLRGAVGMALSGPDTGGSQFFLTHSPQPHLDGGYTVFGWVIEGMDAADRVVQDDAIEMIIRSP